MDNDTYDRVYKECNGKDTEDEVRVNTVVGLKEIIMAVKCNGLNCTALDGFGHSGECEKEHCDAVHYGAGNRHRSSRYRGYKGEPLQEGASSDQRAAWKEGEKARL